MLSDELVEKLAEQLREQEVPIKGQWEKEQEHVRQSYREQVLRFIAAVQAAGLIIEEEAHEETFDIDKFKEVSTKRRARKGAR